MNRSSDNWETPAQSLFVSDGDDMCAIHLQRVGRRPAHCRHADDLKANPPKVVLPKVLARIEHGKFQPGFYIHHRLSRPLAQRAGDTGKRKIFQRRRATSGLRDDVINVKAGFLGKLGQGAVFTPVSGTINNRLPQEGRNQHGLTPLVCPNARSASGAMTGNRSCPPNLQLRGVRYPSRLDLNLACPATRATGARRLWAAEADPNRRAFQLPFESFETYANQLRQSCTLPTPKSSQL